MVSSDNLWLGLISFNMTHFYGTKWMILLVFDNCFTRANGTSRGDNRTQQII